MQYFHFSFEMRKEYYILACKPLAAEKKEENASCEAQDVFANKVTT